jgi:hypothetical protein
MGLTILINAVIDIFGGTLAIRSKQHLLTLGPDRLTTSAPRPNVYRALLRAHPQHTPPFRGNMLTIRLPLRHAATRA